MQDIREVLAELDSENDDVWTEDGLPRVDAVSSRLGREVTRQQIVDAAPEFNRVDMVIPDYTEEEGPEPVDLDEIEVKQKELEALDKELAQIDDEMERLKKLKDEVSAKRHPVAESLGLINDATTNQQRIQAYIETQKRVRLERHEKAQEAQAMLAGRKLDPRSEIDKALSRRKKEPRRPRNMGV